MIVNIETVKELRELTDVGMIESKEILQVHQGDLEKTIAYLRLTGDEPESSGLTRRKWLVTKVDGSENVYYNHEEFLYNYKPMRGDGGKYVSPIGRYSYMK